VCVPAWKINIVGRLHNDLENVILNRRDNVPENSLRRPNSPVHTGSGQR
jgi:hypothetical protein